MPVNFMPTAADYSPLPAGDHPDRAGTLLMVLDALLGEDDAAQSFGHLTLVALAAALVAAVAANSEPGPAFSTC